ncbi:prepilin-type N-terminal cleavage/methylation domain-containing protein [Desulfobulbus sp. F4]|nr:prepilin-type N-terminal cleavage/methylation domain-containing protein [Desulfobulbus sp. F3]MCW5200528.1 prepilin-type N-terminal cleavage/methylation domain-containing protein [Desulfobulbus sp. F4]
MNAARSSYLTRETAFTLLEVMVAVAVIAMSFTALLASQSRSLSVAALARFEAVASLLAKQKLAELEAGGFENLNSGSGEFADDFSEYRWQAEVKELAEDETGIKGSEGMLKLIELTVKREEKESVEVRTVVMAKIEPAEEEPRP